jgi:hypothetical protein
MLTLYLSLFWVCQLLQLDYRSLHQGPGGWLLPPFVTRLRLHIKVSVWWLLPPSTTRLLESASRFRQMTAGTFCSSTCSSHQGSGWTIAVTFCNLTMTPHQGFCLMTAANFYNSTIGVHIKVLMDDRCHLLQIDLESASRFWLDPCCHIL